MDGDIGVISQWKLQVVGQAPDANENPTTSSTSTDTSATVTNATSATDFGASSPSSDISASAPQQVNHVSPVGVIIGGIIGGCLVLLLLIVAIAMWRRKQRIHCSSKPDGINSRTESKHPSAIPTSYYGPEKGLRNQGVSVISSGSAALSEPSADTTMTSARAELPADGRHDKALVQDDAVDDADAASADTSSVQEPRQRRVREV